MITPEQIAWAAGLIEGEGSIQSAVRSRRGSNGEPLLYVRIRVVMTDRDVLERLASIFGGTAVVEYRNLQGLGTKQLYRWEIGTRAAVTEVCDLIYPWMGSRRREQIDRLRSLVATNPPISAEERNRRTWASRRANMARKSAA